MLIDLLLVARILIGQIEQGNRIVGHEGMPHRIVGVLLKELDHAHDLEKHNNSLEHKALYLVFAYHLIGPIDK